MNNGRQNERVIITAREFYRFSDSYWAAPAKLLHEIRSLGFEPVLSGPWHVPVEAISPRPALVILTGGESVGKNSARDNFERELIRESISRGISILGICRGAQMLSSFFGSQLVKVDNHVAQKKTIVVEGLGQGRVTCFHKDGIESVPSEFDLFAESEDGLVEGIVHKELPILGIQWHPEREDDSSPFSTVPVLRIALGLD